VLLDLLQDRGPRRLRQDEQQGAEDQQRPDRQPRVDGERPPPRRRGVSGRAYCVTLVGSARTVNISGGLFKAVFNANNGAGADLRSTMYFLEAQGVEVR